MTEFNVNNFVRVKLTNYGMSIYEKNSMVGHKPDENGFYRFQLWELMNIFGAHMTMGSDIPFVDNLIYFDFDRNNVEQRGSNKK